MGRGYAIGGFGGDGGDGDRDGSGDGDGVGDARYNFDLGSSAGDSLPLRFELLFNDKSSGCSEAVDVSCFRKMSRIMWINKTNSKYSFQIINLQSVIYLSLQIR